MYPVLTFSAGILAGVFALRWLKNGKVQAGIEAAQEKVADAAAGGQEKLRVAAVAGLAAVEQSSARLRGRLAPAAAKATAEAEAPAARRAPRRAAAKKAAKKGGAQS